MRSLLSLLLSAFVLVLLVRAVLSWIPQKRGFLADVDRVVYAITEPVLAPIRSVLPPVGGLDLSFLAVIVAIWIIRAVFHL